MNKFSTSTLEKLALALECSVSDLVRDTEDDTIQKSEILQDIDVLEQDIQELIRNIIEKYNAEE